MDFCSGEVSDEKVSDDWSIDHVDGDHVALKAGFGGCCGNEAGLIRVVVIDVYDGVESSFDEMCEEELHVSGFVASEREARCVVSFEEDTRNDVDVGVHGFCDCGA